MKRRLNWPGLILLVIAMGGVGLAGCKEDGNTTRNVVLVAQIADGGPVLSDVYNFGANNDLAFPDDDFIPVDVISVIFESRVHDAALETVLPGRPFGSVTLNSYSVVFDNGTNADGADLNDDTVTDLFNFSAPTNILIPVDNLGFGNILLIDGGSKAVAPIGCLSPFPPSTGCSGNNDVEYSTNALITFSGTEETSGDAVQVVTGVTIRIAQFGDL